MKKLLLLVSFFVVFCLIALPAVAADPVMQQAQALFKPIPQTLPGDRPQSRNAGKG